MISSFIFFLAVFVLIGLSSSVLSKNNRKDYYLAGHSISPWLVGLSAVATNNSGYMFIGVIGYTYVTGLASLWLMIGWIAGDFMMSSFIHARVQQASLRSGADSYAALLSSWGSAKRNRLYQRTAALVSLVFLTAYASAQFVAGGKALQVLFAWPAFGGAVLSAILVTAYCFAGGIRASIWTDAAQSFVMLMAMSLLLFSAVQAQGGLANTVDAFYAIDGFMDWTPAELALPGISGLLLFALSWMFAGMSVIGQPHIMVRFMTLKADRNMLSARLWYYGWYIAFYSMATAVGMLSRLFIVDSGSFDAELALPTMAMQLLSPALSGLILAGMFAATMSTADSLVLSCSASLTHDLLPEGRDSTWVLKLATLGITLIALSWALLNKQSVFNLVIMAWSALASAFAPLLIVLALGGRPSQKLMMSMLFCGLAIALLWRYCGWHSLVYEGMPGILSGLLVYYLHTRWVAGSRP